MRDWEKRGRKRDREKEEEEEEEVEVEDEEEEEDEGEEGRGKGGRGRNIHRVRVSTEVRVMEQSSPGPTGSTEEQGFQTPHLPQHWAGPRRQGVWDPQQSPESWSGRLGASEEEGKSPRHYPPTPNR